MTPKLFNILLLTLSAALYYAVINPLYFNSGSVFFSESENIQALKEKRDTYDKTIAAVPGLISQAKLSMEQYNALSEDDRKKIMTMVPVEVDEIKLMSELTNIGVASGVPIDGMGIKDKGNGVYSVSFDILTTYANFKNIMAYWENSMRLFTLQSVSFAPGKNEEEPIKFTIELSTYYMK